MPRVNDPSRLKPSSVEWLGDVPERWKALGCKFAYSIQLGKMLQNEPQSAADVKVPYLKALHVQWETVDTSALPEMWASQQDIKKFVVRSGDLLVCEGGEVGRAGMLADAPDDCIIQNALHRVRAKGRNDAQYLMYLLKVAASGGWFDVICSKATIAHFTGEKFGEFSIVLPPPDEQRTIVAYLDRETSRIDALIEKKQRQIELLREKRTALISRAVTKGLDSDAKMEDSGIEWLGEIPTHWDVLAIKRITSVPITDGPHETPELLEEGISFISAEAIKNDRIDFTKMRGFISPEEHARFSKKYKPKRGDIYLIKSGATTGNVAFVDTDEEFNIWSPLAAIRPHPKMAMTLFIFYFMKSRNFFQSVELGWTYGTQQNIGMNVIENLPVVRPPLTEQRTIVAYLNRETTRIDALIEKVEKSIDLLREYRTSLISAAVTGKIDVQKETAV